MSKRCILGVTTSGHGVGAALCIDGTIIAANTLERLTRKKYDILLPISKTDLQTFGWKNTSRIYEENMDLPFDLKNDYTTVDFNEVEGFSLLIEHVLAEAGITLKDVDCVAYSYRHNKSAERFFKQKNTEVKFVVPEHHFSHVCQAYFPSGFDEAAILILDGQGVPMARTNYDQLSGCLAYGKGDSIEVLLELPVVCSLGDMYAQFTRMCGFKTNEEGKTMGLAPYGTAEYYEKYKKNLHLGTNKSVFKNIRDLFGSGAHRKKNLYNLGDYCSFLKDFTRRESRGELTDTYKNLAYLAQKTVEDVMIHLAEWLYKKTGSKNLCIAGGVGLNCVANYKVLANSSFENIFIYPNAGDNGLSVGQALYVDNVVYGNPRSYQVRHDYLGKSYSNEDVEKIINTYVSRDDIEISEFKNIDSLYEAMADYISDGKIAAWWQERSEFGPRALGNRSILADPRRKDMKDILNSRVKFRENYRPFTPSVLADRAGEFFEIDIESPFMLLAPYVKPGKAELVPAITHVDNTARVQTVTKDVNEKYYGLIKTFEKHTGIPMVLNTSFNVAGEPIVENPEDAISCFLSTDIDVLGIDRFFIKKKRTKT